MDGVILWMTVVLTFFARLMVMLGRWIDSRLVRKWWRLLYLVGRLGVGFFLVSSYTL